MKRVSRYKLGCGKSYYIKNKIREEEFALRVSGEIVEREYGDYLIVIEKSRVFWQKHKGISTTITEEIYDEFGIYRDDYIYELDAGEILVYMI